MSKQHRWLHAELAHWREEGLIGADQAAALAARYPLAEGRAWGQLVFYGIGAVVAGLGVILFFAYNWEALPKAAKLALVFGAIAAAHGAGLWVRPRSAAAGEALHAFGTMLFGAGIWLVAQVYHIDEHYPNGILLWSLGALALAWALPSLTQALMAALLLGLWASFEALDFARGAHWGPPLVALGLLPLAWTMRSRVLVFFALASLFAVVFFATFPDLEELAVIVAFLTGLSFLMAGLALPASPFPGAAAPARVLGFVIYLGFLYVLGFEDAAEVLEDAELDRWLAVAYFAVPLALAIAAAALAFRRGRAGLGPWFGHWLAALVSILLVAGLTPAGIQGIELPVAIACNLLFLAHCLVFIQQGCRHADVVQVSVACVMLAALVLARYVDLFESLLVRSAVFLLLGAALFGIGMLYARAKRRLAETPA